MSINIGLKKEIVEGLKVKLENVQTIVLAEYRGINVTSMTQLRKQAREKNVYLKVLKNSLFRRAIKGTAFEILSNKAVGPLIYSISDDPISAAKILNSFSKSEDNIKIKVGFYNGKILDVNQVIELANIPSRDELLAKLLGIIQAPVSSFARSLLALANKNEEDSVKN